MVNSTQTHHSDESDTVSESSHSNSEDDDDDWQDNTFGSIQDFQFDSTTAGINIDCSNVSHSIDFFFF